MGMAWDLIRGKQINPQFFASMFPKYESETGRWQPRDYQKQVDAVKSWVYACISVIAKRVAELEIYLYQKVRDEKGVHLEKITEHPFLDLMKNVNDWENNWELKYLIASNLEATGNAYIYLVPNKLNLPSSIWNIPSQKIKIMPDDKNFIRGYIYTGNMGQQIVFSPDEIIHFKFPSLSDVFYGASPIEACCYAVDLNEYMKRYSTSLMKNRGNPGGLLISKTETNEESRNRLIDWWNKTYRGVDKTGKIGILWGDLDYKQLNISPKDLDWVLGQKMVRDEICAIFGVPVSKLGLAENVSRANNEANDFTFNKEVIKPLITLIQEKINEKLLPRYDEKLVCQFEDPMPKWFDDEIRERETNIRIGYTSINEERAKEGLAEVKWGRTPIMPMGVMNLDTKPEITKIKKELPKINQSKFDIEKKEKIWKEMIIRTMPIIKQFSVAMKEYFAKQKKEVLDNLKKLSKSIEKKLREEDIDHILFSSIKAKKELKKLSRGYIEDAYESGAISTIATYGFDIAWDITNPKVQEWIGMRAEKFSDWANETTLGELRSALSQGIEEGESIPHLQERIETIFDFASETRAEMIARTEVITANNMANLEVFEEAGLKHKEWVTAFDDRTCEECVDLDGVVIGVREEFAPGILTPALHVNCRCTCVGVE